jgi:hypothetical protein
MMDHLSLEASRERETLSFTIFFPPPAYIFPPSNISLLLLLLLLLLPSKRITSHTSPREGLVIIHTSHPPSSPRHSSETPEPHQSKPSPLPENASPASPLPTPRTPRRRHRWRSPYRRRCWRACRSHVLAAAAGAVAAAEARSADARADDADYPDHGGVKEADQDKRKGLAKGDAKSC